MLSKTGEERKLMENRLKLSMKPGSADVNIMTKLDRTNHDSNNNELPEEYCDAMAALRGFAKSELNSSIVLSAGLNPRLFAYMETFSDFFPGEEGSLKKKIILKVSDFRSAMIQGKFLAKKGLWISEFRIESGLNCGGHAFPTEGKLMGPILQEFYENRETLKKELLNICNQALRERNRTEFQATPRQLLTVQGGIGTAYEDGFLREHYQLDGTGWGSPFLMVPEVTSVDEDTLFKLTKASKDDYYLSHASPLGIPFNNFRQSSAEDQRTSRIERKRPGSPCHYEHLASNKEFTEKDICLASRDFQRRKIKELKSKSLSEKEYISEFNLITEKDCLCAGLSSSILLKNNLNVPYKLKAVTICPGPNLAYFSNVFSLEQMVGHIYGRNNVLNLQDRSHVFINELNMYIDYLKTELKRQTGEMTESKKKYFDSFRTNLSNGISYYKELIPRLRKESLEFKSKCVAELENASQLLNSLFIEEELKF